MLTLLIFLLLIIFLKPFAGSLIKFLCPLLLIPLIPIWLVIIIVKALIPKRTPINL